MSPVSPLRRVAGERLGHLAGEDGVLLPLAIIMMAIGSMVIVTLLSLTATSARAQLDFDDLAPTRYSADSGVVDVLVDLLSGEDALTSTYSTPSLTINEYDVAISVQTPTTTVAAEYRYLDPGVAFGLASLSSQDSHYIQIDNVEAGAHVRVNWSFTPTTQSWTMRLYEEGGPPGAGAATVLATDDFESNSFTGGTGWTAAWTTGGSASIETTGGPFEGTYHALLAAGTGQITREASFGTSTDVRIRFWAKVDSFEAGDTASCSVSPDDAAYTVIRTWLDGEDDNVYRFEDIDVWDTVSSTTSLFFRCDANMDAGGDLFYIDDVEVVSHTLPPIIAESSDTKAPGGLFVDGSLITGGTYTIEFRNDSAADLVSNTYATDGSLNRTWVYTQAFRDYLITGTAESSTISTFVRQFPGRTVPVTAQEIFILSWSEP